MLVLRNFNLNNKKNIEDSKKTGSQERRETLDRPFDQYDLIEQLMLIHVSSMQGSSTNGMHPRVWDSEDLAMVDVKL